MCAQRCDFESAFHFGIHLPPVTFTPFTEPWVPYAITLTGSDGAGSGWRVLAVRRTAGNGAASAAVLRFVAAARTCAVLRRPCEMMAAYALLRSLVSENVQVQDGGVHILNRFVFFSFGCYDVLPRTAALTAQGSVLHTEWCHSPLCVEGARGDPWILWSA